MRLPHVSDDITRRIDVPCRRDFSNRELPSVLSASRFGAVLDMVTDRCSTAGLLLVLSRLYDHSHAFGFLVLMFLDLSSHWMHTHR